MRSPKRLAIISLVFNCLCFNYYNDNSCFLFSFFKIISSWWKIATHLGWSLLDLSEGLSPLESTDSNSEALAQLLFAVYLVLVLIMLVNMLIALLSNTYQRVQVTARYCLLL